tara:strand:+ start:154 stop:1524 length:1371 start_codon:yes stop_codon:yes gene_type:complete
MALNPRQMLGLNNTRPSMQYQQLNNAYQSDPRRMLGQTLMAQGASSAPVRTPLQGLGRLSSALVGAYLQRKAGDAQVERETAMTDQIMGMLPATATPQQRAAVSANPAAFQQMIAQAQFQPTSKLATQELPGAPGAVVVGTETTGALGGTTFTPSSVYKPPATPKQDFVTLTKQDGTSPVTLPLGDPRIGTLLTDGFIERKSSTAPTVNITQKGNEAFETTFAKGLGDIQVEQLRAVSQQAEDAAINVDSIESILTLYNRAESEGVNLAELTGPGAEFKLNLKEAAADIAGVFGISIDDMGFDVEKITDQQTLRSAFNRLSLEMTKLLKGAISEKELKIASNATANFGNTAEANRMILLTQRAAAVKARLVESEMLNYKDEIGNLGRGTYKGKKYNSFTQFKREFVNQDKEFIVKQVVQEINSLAEMKALVKISGGLSNLSDETIDLMEERRAQLQ